MDTILPTRRAGLLESALQKLYTRDAHVLELADAGAFRIVTLGGEALRGAAWTPGDKLQVQLGGWVQRTYTPIDWDADNGRTRIAMYLHADGPGTRWARTLRQGDRCVLFGPRKSVRLAQPQAPVILFGDETAIGLAAALARHAPLQLLLETSAAADSMALLRQLGLAHAHLCARRPDDAHFPALEDGMLALLRAQPDAQIVLSGKAGSIQHISRLLRREDIAAGQRQSKAYWAPGKTGMD